MLNAENNRGKPLIPAANISEKKKTYPNRRTPAIGNQNPSPARPGRSLAGRGQEGIETATYEEEEDPARRQRRLITVRAFPSTSACWE